MEFSKELKKIDELKAEIEKLGPLDPALVKNLDGWYRVELTYTSNAIEGNTLTLRETAELIEHGITVGENPCAIILKRLTTTRRSYGCANWRPRRHR